MNIIKEGYGYYLIDDSGTYKIYVLDEFDSYLYISDLDFNGYPNDDYLKAFGDFLGAF